jgi:radical SAM superfamily enzyme YgiQ (UPF0313 family)
MARLLLTHGYFLAEDEKEQAIMKPYPPLGLLYLAAWLKGLGHRVDVYDSTFGDRRELQVRFAAWRGVVGVYTNLMTRVSVLSLIRSARAAGCRVVLGGPESANYAAEYLQAGAECVVIGEGEQTLAELLPRIENDAGEAELGAIPGIAFLGNDGCVVRTPPRARLPDIDTLPFPDREAIDHGRYLDVWRSRHGASSVNLITARGCPYLCNWCSHAVYGHSHRRRSPENVANEVQWIAERYRPDQLWYADDVFTISHPWMESFLALLQRRRLILPFETITRADRLQTPAAARTLRELGCQRIWIGSESGSQRILDAMQRGVTVAQVRRAVALAKAEGIEVGMFLMWGYEGEEYADIAATVEHVCETDPDVYFTTVSYPIRGTPYFERVADRVRAERPWAESTDRDLQITGRRDRGYYRMADEWLRFAVDARRLEREAPQRAATLRERAERARLRLAQLAPGA